MQFKERFKNRHSAGRLLADQLGGLANETNISVVALPRGGVPVGYELAKRLAAPLEIFTVRKIGVPEQREYAMGSIASSGHIYLDRELVRRLNLTESMVNSVIERERIELNRRDVLYRNGQPAPELKGRQLILVDDGLATGASMIVAIHAMRSLQPESISVAVPVIAQAAVCTLNAEADHLYYVQAPPNFRAVGEWYEDFTQVSDDEVQTLLTREPSFTHPAVFPILAAAAGSAAPSL